MLQLLFEEFPGVQEVRAAVAPPPLHPPLPPPLPPPMLLCIPR